MNSRKSWSSQSSGRDFTMQLHACSRRGTHLSPRISLKLRNPRLLSNR